MAEIFGAVAGALSIAALFNNCVDCFGYIQLGRRFGRDFERCQLRLDVARIRLGRWGEAVGIREDPRFSSQTADEQTQKARELLEDIGEYFYEAHNASKRYKRKADPRDLELYGANDMQPAIRGVHSGLREICQRRQKGTSLLKKVAWALYEAKLFDKLVSDITTAIDDLEKLIPPPGARSTQLAKSDVEEVGNVLSEPILATLKDAAEGVDNALAAAVAEKIAVAGTNRIKTLTIKDSVKFSAGNFYSEEALAYEVLVKDQTVNTAETVVAEGKSRIHVGNMYGGKSIWDD